MVAINVILLPQCTGEECGGDNDICTDSRVHHRNSENRAPVTRNHRSAPILGRWLTRDPFGYQGGINLYGYVGSGPVEAVDATGKAAGAVPLGWTPSQLSLAARGADLAAKSVGAYIKGHEGLRLTAYHGPLHRNLTIGYGHNLATPRGKARLHKVLKSNGRAKFYNAILQSKCKITKEEAGKLFNIDLLTARKAAEHDFSNFAKVPTEVQKALLDMEFNMGSLAGWKNLRKAVESDNWHQAGIQILSSKYASQLPSRADDNAGLVFDWALITSEANEAVEYIMGISNQWP